MARPKHPVVNRTSWKKGQSGNPAGYPKQTTDWRSGIRANAKLHDLALRAALGELSAAEMRTLNADMLKFHIEHGHGRAPQTIRLEGMISVEEAVRDTREFLEQHGLVEKFEQWLTAKAKEEHK
jgi:hypothetical protein